MAGRPKKPTIKVQVSLLPETLKALKDFKIECKRVGFDHVDTLNKILIDVLKIENHGG